MQVSHSRVDCFIQCPQKFKFRYIEELETIPDDKADNALYLGTALHTGLEVNTAEAIKQYYSNYPIITDDHINETIKLEVMIEKARNMVPEGINEVEISDEHFHGFIDLLVPVETNGMLQVYDIYDFKYSNNKQNYTESDQLHLYKYFYEKNNPLCSIRNMYFLMVPKSKCKPFKGEDLVSYRKRLLLDLKKLTPELVPIEYDPSKVIQFLLQTKELLEATEHPKRRGFLCNYCNYSDYCLKGVNYMLLPENKRRTNESTTKKVIWIYGSPFSGKTTFANSFPDPLMLNTDGNIKFVDAPYIAIKDVVTKNGRMTERKMAWEVFKEVIAELELKENTFKTIVVDLLEDTYEHCRLYVCKQKGWEHESDDSFKAWDMVRTEFLSTLKRLMNLDYENIILISHLDSTKDITKRSGDKITSIKPNLADKVANKVAGMVDIVGRAVADDNNYTLSFKKNEVIFGGGRLAMKESEISLSYDEFCKLYDEASDNKNTVVYSDAQNVPSEDHSDNTDDTDSEVSTDSQEVTDSDSTPVDNKTEADSTPEEGRRRKRRTE